MTAPLQHRIGEEIAERYEVLDTLGSGAFGTVYHCRDLELDTDVAIKELHVLEPDDREAALVRFRQEAVNLSQLRHPHIVSGYYQPHAGTWLVCPICGYSFRGAKVCPHHGAAPIVVKQRHYLVMEYLRGPDLYQAAEERGGALDINTALNWITPVGDALRLIHSRGLVHRDIKPENIRLRTRNGDPVLLDFGIATVMGEEGGFGTRQFRHTTGGGTLGYAPESSQERRFPDARSDIHALGMTLYSLVTGLDPLEDEDLEKMRMESPRVWNQQIPQSLEELILRAIDPDPRRRYQNIEEFLDDLNEIDEFDDLGSARATTGRNTASRSSTAIVPFTFRSGAQARSLEELVQLLDRDRAEAKEYLYSGDIAQWLAHIGRADLAQRAREVVEEYPTQKFQGLEALAQATGLVPPPQLNVQPRFLDFGTVNGRDRKTVPLNVTNSGRGHLFGILYSPTRGLEFPDNFDGNRQTIPIAFDARGLERGVHEGEVVLDTSAGVLRLPFRAQVQEARVERPAGHGSSVSVVLWGVLGMLCGYLLRALPLAHEQDGQSWLTGSPLAGHLAWFPTVPLFGAAMLGSVFALLTAEATRRRSWWFFLGALLPSFLFASMCGLLAQTLLPAGDDALQPLSRFVGNWASGGWLILGGFLGAIYGTLRHVRDLFSLRVFEVIGGWTFFGGVLAAIVWLVRWLLGLASGAPV